MCFHFFEPAGKGALDEAFTISRFLLKGTHTHTRTNARARTLCSQQMSLSAAFCIQGQADFKYVDTRYKLYKWDTRNVIMPMLKVTSVILDNYIYMPGPGSP